MAITLTLTSEDLALVRRLLVIVEGLLSQQLKSQPLPPTDPLPAKAEPPDLPAPQLPSASADHHDEHNTAQHYASAVLPLAVNCLNQAIEVAINEAQATGKVFSPQNWCKNRASVQSETLVAGTMIGTLKGVAGLPGGEAQAMLLERLAVPAGQFGLRWSAE